MHYRTAYVYRYGLFTVGMYIQRGCNLLFRYDISITQYYLPYTYVGRTI
jgi:hypothetical protein